MGCTLLLDVLVIAGDCLGVTVGVFLLLKGNTGLSPVFRGYLCTDPDATGVWVPDSGVCVCDAGGLSSSALSYRSSPEV